MVIFSRKPVSENHLPYDILRILYWPVTFEPHSAVSMKQYTVLKSFTLHNYNYLFSDHNSYWTSKNCSPFEIGQGC